MTLEVVCNSCLYMLPDIVQNSYFTKLKERSCSYIEDYFLYTHFSTSWSLAPENLHMSGNFKRLVLMWSHLCDHLNPN